MKTFNTFSLGRYTILILAILLMSANSRVYAQNSDKEDKGKFTLWGSVRDKATGGQLIGAGVRIYNSADSVVGEGKAESRRWSSYENALLKSSDFRIEIPHVKDIYTLEVIYENYDPLYQIVNLRDMGGS